MVIYHTSYIIMKLYLCVDSLCFYSKRLDLHFCMKSGEGSGDSLEGEDRLLQNNKGKS
jgi:hypothetical protein